MARTRSARASSHRRLDHQPHHRPDAGLLREEVQPRQHRACLRRQDRLGRGRRPGQVALFELGRPDVRAPGRRAQSTGAFEAVLRAEDNQQTVIGVADAPPLEDDDRFAAQLLATVLGDHTGSRLYWELVDPGHADSAEVSYQDYNKAGTYYTFLSCEPEETQANLARVVEVYREAMPRGSARKS